MIDEFYVDKEFRNRGIGTDILSLVIKNSKKLGLKSLYLEVGKNNTIAQNMYKKLNFKARENYFLMNLDLT